MSDDQDSVLPSLAPFSIDLTSDGHVHTELCHHARGGMEEYVLAAIERGLREVVFLEHFEAGIDYFEATWLTPEDFDRYFEQGLRLRERYEDRIRIGLGVEVGYNPGAVKEIQAFLSQHAWDRIGLSLHFCPNPASEGPGHLNLVSRRPANLEAFPRIGIAAVVREYLAGLIEAVEQLPGTVLCHVDAVLRHLPGVRLDEGNRPQLEKLFQKAAARGMALEVNTSGFDLRGEPFPARWVLTLARRFGMMFTAGSDAHRPEQVGRYFDRLPEWMARDAETTS